MAADNARQRFLKAVEILVDEKDRIKERLLVAYAAQLSRVDPHHDLPDSMVATFKGLRAALSDADMPFGYGERAATKIQDMSEDEAAELARTIFSIFLQLHDLTSEISTS